MAAGGNPPNSNAGLRFLFSPQEIFIFSGPHILVCFIDTPKHQENSYTHNPLTTHTIDFPHYVAYYDSPG